MADPQGFCDYHGEHYRDGRCMSCQQEEEGYTLASGPCGDWTPADEDRAR